MYSCRCGEAAAHAKYASALFEISEFQPRGQKHIPDCRTNLALRRKPLQLLTMYNFEDLRHQAKGTENLALRKLVSYNKRN